MSVRTSQHLVAHNWPSQAEANLKVSRPFSRLSRSAYRAPAGLKFRRLVPPGLSFSTVFLRNRIPVRTPAPGLQPERAPSTDVRIARGVIAAAAKASA